MKNILNKIDKLISATAKNEETPFTSAIILAAGKSTRAPGGTTKQLTEIEGIPVVIKSALLFQSSNLINEIVIVAAENEIALYDEFIERYSLSKVTKIVKGGKFRAESAKNGFFATDKKSKFIVVHDCARCFVTINQIEEVIKLAYKYGAAIAAVKSVDTIKRADKDGFVSKTLDRKYIWRAQTPQAFLKKLYEISLAKAGDAYIYATDDASLAEASGFKVKLVECGENNIKITYPEDFERVMLKNSDNKRGKK